jgi:hypothetical protein
MFSLDMNYTNVLPQRALRTIADRLHSLKAVAPIESEVIVNLLTEITLQLLTLHCMKLLGTKLQDLLAFFDDLDLLVEMINGCIAATTQEIINMIDKYITNPSINQIESLNDIKGISSY